MRDARLTEMLGRARAVLFDFDGPVCSVFSGVPAPAVARDLRDLLRRDGNSLAPEVEAEQDPLAVLRYAERLGPFATRRTDDLLIESERRAVAVAEPNPGGTALLRSCAAAGRSVAVVTNNSAQAATAYLSQHQMLELVDVIVGRPYAEPSRMKPNPEPLKHALDALGVDAAESVFVGDSPSDVEACRSAGITCIAYARDPDDVAQLSAAAFVVDDLERLCFAPTG